LTTLQIDVALDRKEHLFTVCPALESTTGLGTAERAASPLTTQPCWLPALQRTVRR
jgi:hypothetical protein